MPTLYTLKLTLEAEIHVVAPDGMTESDALFLVRLKADDILRDETADVDVESTQVLTLQEAVDRPAEDYRVDDARTSIVNSEVDWIEGFLADKAAREAEMIERGETPPPEVSKNQIRLFG